MITYTWTCGNIQGKAGYTVHERKVLLLRSYCKKKSAHAKYAAYLKKIVPPSLPIHLVKYALCWKCAFFAVWNSSGKILFLWLLIVKSNTHNSNIYRTECFPQILKERGAVKLFDLQTTHWSWLRLFGFVYFISPSNSCRIGSFGAVARLASLTSLRHLSSPMRVLFRPG